MSSGDQLRKLLVSSGDDDADEANTDDDAPVFARLLLCWLIKESFRCSAFAVY